MRSPVNLAMVVAAGALALVLTVIRQTPEGTGVGISIKQVRAAPGTSARADRYELSALKIFNLTLLKIKERYVDPGRVDPKKMLYAALDSVQLNIPEVLVEPDAARNKVKVTVNDRPMTFETDDVDSSWRLAAKLKSIFKFIEKNMNASDDLAKVEYAATNGMLSTLDPHSVLMDPESARDMDVSTSGKFGGLGIVIRLIENKLTVVKPMKDTPAWKKGIKAGDHIVRINNEPTENLTSNEAVDRMRGDPKTGVTLWVQRKGESQLLRFDLVRDVIRMSQVEHKLLGKGVGYIKVKQFSKGISRDVAEAMRVMQGQGATAWILDLRSNPGGLLEEAIQLSDLFVDRGTVVTTVSGNNREARRAEHGFGDASSSLALLVNGNSASASEIVAGALKNLDRAVIIGTRTFGKGTVQELYDNDDRSKLKLTIAQYLTPGDRSIQNLGIVPDIALMRMYIPEKNESAKDFVRMLPPTRTYGEKDLDATLVSTYAKDTDKPAFEVPFLVERKKQTDPSAPVAPPRPDDDDADDADDIVEDFEMRFARDLVSSVTASTRPKLVAGASRLVQQVRADEERKLVTALSAITVDWSAPAAGPAANLEATITTAPAGAVKAGETITVTATVKNTGTGTAYRVLPRLHTDDNVFDDTELPIGKLAPGETKTFVTKIEVPKDADDRLDHIGLEVREARNAPVRVTPATLRVTSLPRPLFAYSYQLIDDGNGDGLVQRGEKYRLAVQLKNTGAGGTSDASVLLRNATGDGVILGKSRVELKDKLAAGQVMDLEFPIATDASLEGDEMIVELIAYDAALDAQSTEKLRFKLAPAVPAVRSSGEVTTRAPLVIRAGASEDASVVGSTQKGASYSVLGAYGAYTKLKLSAAGKVGFVPTAGLSSGAGGSAGYTAAWNSTPPVIALAYKSLESSGDSYRLNGTVSSDDKVEDVYVFVSNQGSKVDSRKVFYRSNRGGRDKKAMAFGADLPLWPGSNMITVVARSNTEVRSVQRLFVYRDSPRTAQAPATAPARP